MAPRSRTPDGGALSDAEVDELLRTLADAECRSLLWYLASTDDRAITVDDAASHVADETDARYESARIALYHHYLPKCDDADLVEYDPDEGEVEYEGDPLAEEVLDVVETVTERPR